MEGVKHDGEKPRWDLMQWGPLNSVVRVLTYGCNKYTRVELMNWELAENILGAQSVVLEKGKLVDFADLVMTKSLNWRIQPIGRGNWRMQDCGVNSIQKKFLKTTKDTEEIIVSKSTKESSEESLIDLASILLNMKNSKKEDVLFAAQNEDCIWITAINQGNLEIYCVANVIKELDSLMIMLNVCKEHLNMLKNIEIYDHDKILISGADNWKLVPGARKRYVAAAFRHMVSYIRGERNDPESGEHHLAHCICCLLFLMSFDNGDGENGN